LDVPEEGQLKTKLAAIGRFQALVRTTLKEGHDYGVIPGTGTKPTLLKPGAEKILKLLELADEYTILDKVEDWQAGFFRYIVKCQARHIGTGVVVSEGLGECNSKESKYRWRWVFGSDVPPEVDKSKLVMQKRRSRKSGKEFTMYRLDNEDIYSQVNTILKMAKKRAEVDASLSVGRLSDMFTQDIEDFKGGDIEADAETGEIAQERTEKAPVPASPRDTGPAPTGQPVKQQDKMFGSVDDFKRAFHAQGVDDTRATEVLAAQWPKGRTFRFEDIKAFDSAWGFLHAAGLVTATPTEFETK